MSKWYDIRKYRDKHFKIKFVSRGTGREYAILKEKAELLDEFVETGVRWKLLHAQIKMYGYIPSPILLKIYRYYDLNKKYEEEINEN